MENPIYISLSRMTALQRQMDVVAGNIANANTTGYKQNRVLFSEMIKHPAANERMSMVQDRVTMHDLSQGPLTATSNPLDLAVSGKGFLVVDTVSGPRYTRAGRLQLDAQRQLVDNSGLPVLGQGNRPISIPAGAGGLRIESDGTIFGSANPTAPLGKLNVVSFEKENQLTEIGAGLYTTPEPPKPAPKDTRILQGVLEESNVKPVVEMTSMMSILRQYQSVQHSVDAEAERQRTMIQRLGRVS